MRLDDDFRPRQPPNGGTERVPFPEDVLDRLLTDSLDEAQGARVRQLLAESPVRQRLLEDVRRWVRRDEAGRDLFDHAAAWAAIRTAIETLEGGAHGHVRGVGARAGWRGWPRAAYLVLGAAVFAVGIGVAGWRLGRGGGAAAGPMVAYTTGNGQRANITLPDGSIVSLDVASRLELPANYQGGNRTVYLTGEALFTVTHHGAHPFTVVAGSDVARALGTSFVVRHYATDTTTVVAVREGRVAVRTAVLAESQQAELSARGTMRVRTASPSMFTFATGTLTLDSMPLSAAIPELNRWYDADIRLGDPSLATRLVTGECAAGSLGDLATVLEWTFGLQVVRHGRVLTLYPR